MDWPQNSMRVGNGDRVWPRKSRWSGCGQPHHAYRCSHQMTWSTPCTIRLAKTIKKYMVNRISLSWTDTMPVHSQIFRKPNASAASNLSIRTYNTSSSQVPSRSPRMDTWIKIPWISRLRWVAEMHRLLTWYRPANQPWAWLIHGTIWLVNTMGQTCRIQHHWIKRTIWILQSKCGRCQSRGKIGSWRRNSHPRAMAMWLSPSHLRKARKHRL